VMRFALILTTAGGVWLLVLLFDIALFRTAQASDSAFGPGGQAAGGSRPGDFSYRWEVSQCAANDFDEFDFGVHPRPTRGSSRPRGGGTAPGPGKTIGIREAAATLGSSPNALRAWEARYGYPVSQLSAPGHERTYRRAEVLALAEAMQTGLSIASAIESARGAVTRR
jgi:hypothetical protein